MAQVRHVREDELVSLCQLYDQLHIHDEARPAGPELDTLWRQSLDHPGMHILVVEAEQQLVATCALVIIPNLTRGGRPYALIENVVTREGFRRRGFGQLVVRHALRLAWDAACYKVMLLTSRSDPGTHQFYEVCDFQAGVKTGFIARPPAT